MTWTHFTMQKHTKLSLHRLLNVHWNTTFTSLSLPHRLKGFVLLLRCRKRVLFLPLSLCSSLSLPHRQASASSWDTVSTTTGQPAGGHDSSSWRDALIRDYPIITAECRERSHKAGREGRVTPSQLSLLKRAGVCVMYDIYSAHTSQTLPPSDASLIRLNIA